MRFMCEMGLGLSDLKNLDFIWICHAPSWVGSQVQKKKKIQQHRLSLSPSWKEVMDASKILLVSCVGIWIVLQD